MNPPYKIELNQIILSKVSIADEISNAIDQGGDVNCRTPFGRVAMQVAMDEVKIENVKVLLAKGAEINILSGFGESPLLTALGLYSSYSESSMSKFNNFYKELSYDLISRGAAVISTAFAGNELHFIGMHGYDDMIVPLMENTLSINPDFNLEETKAYDKQSPIDIAIENGHDRCVEIMQSFVTHKRILELAHEENKEPVPLRMNRLRF